MESNRQNQRKLVGLLVKLAHKGVDEFAEKYATNISEGGMFIRTREPKPVGTELSFKIELASGQRVLQGTGIVRWARGDNDPGGPAGMGIEFGQLDPASRALVDRMVGRGAPPPSVAPTRAPGAVPKVAPLSQPPPHRSAARGANRHAPIELPPVDEDEPFELTAPSYAPPPQVDASRSLAPKAPPPPPAPEAPALNFNLEEDLFQGVGQSAHPENEVGLDLDSLLSPPEAAQPAPSAYPSWGEPSAPASAPPPFDPFASSDSGIAIELEPLDAAPAAPQSLGQLPQIRRGPAPPPSTAPATPVTLDSEKPAPPRQQKGLPVYLRDVKMGDGTGPIIGIDLGTTNSACAVLSKGGRPLILASKDGYNTIPSVVALTQQGKLQVGHRARSQMVLNPTQSIFGAKRLVGRDYDSPTVRQVKDRAHFEIVPSDDGRAAVKLGHYTLSLEEIQGLILKECRDMAEQALGSPVNRAVVTCPAYYSEVQREAVRRAGAMCGLKVERVLNEPTAAALAFGMNRELSKTVLVYDLGGGTFDATLLKLDKNVFEVLATGGDVFLGGVDFDNQIVDLLLQRFVEGHKRPFSGDRVALSRINEAAEKAKMALSERASYDVHLPMLEMDGMGRPLDLRTTLTRQDVESACAELIERTIQAVHDVLLDARLKPSQVDDIILVGGMSRMPLVRDKLKELFKKPAHASVNADEAVALGAALYTGTVDKVSSLVLIDVVPMTIGLGKPGGGFQRLIERNTPLPATKSFGLTTQRDDETELEVMVFQGEDSNVAANEFLGAITITGLPKGPKGAVQVAVTVALDAECVLRVEAREFKSRTVVRSTLATRYTSEEIAQKLGITAEKREQVNQKRGEELEKRAGGFWGKLKKLFGR